jgi:hypothetical protein
MTDLEAQKAALRLEMQKNRAANRYTSIPQIGVLAVMALALAAIAGYGLYVAAEQLRADHNVATFAKSLPVFVGGSASAVSILVLKLLTRISDLSREFVHQEKQFASHIAKVGLSLTEADVRKVLDGYTKR